MPGDPAGSLNPEYPNGFFQIPPGYPHAGRIIAAGGFLTSDDLGATWRGISRSGAPGTDGKPYDIKMLPSGRLVTAGEWGVAYSDDGGDSFASTPLWGEYEVQQFALNAIATPGSMQSGAPACGLSNTSLCDGLIVIGSQPGVDEMVAWTSNDGGRSFTARQVLPEPRDGIYHFQSTGVLNFGSGADGLGRALTVLGRGTIYVTEDGGQTWRSVGRVPIVRMEGYIFHVALGPDGHLYAVENAIGPTAGRIHRTNEPALALFPVSSASAPAPRPALWVGVSPNPSAGAVAFEIATPAGGPARVEVVDALGRRVAILHDGPLAAGSHRLTADFSTLPAGVYAVRVRVGEGYTLRAFTLAR